MIPAPTDSLTLSAEEIRAAMERGRINQHDIVRETGLSPTTVSRICRGLYTSDGDAVQATRGVIDRALKERGHPLIAELEAESAKLGRAPIAVAVSAAIPQAQPSGSVVSLPGAAAERPGIQAVPGHIPGSASGRPGIQAAARLPEPPPSLSAPWGGAYCTQGQRLMWASLRATIEDRELCLLVALSGAGKTYLIDRYRESYPETLVYRPLRGISQSGLLEDLCRLFGVPYGGSNDTRRRRLLESAQGRALIIDEADLLVVGRYARMAVDRLEIYRQLQERGAAVALVGLPALLHTIVTGGETYVFSRIGYARTASPPSTDELATYWRAQMAGYPQAAAKAGTVSLRAARHGHLRYLDKLARRTRALDGDVAAAETLLFRGEQA